MSADYSVSYNAESFWNKIVNFAKKAGREVIEKALILYYTLQDPDTPLWAKTVIIGALGYFISPIDAIPDVVPVAGFTDDLGVLASAMITVACCIKPVHREMAKNKLHEWFN